MGGNLVHIYFLIHCIKPTIQIKTETFYFTCLGLLSDGVQAQTVDHFSRCHCRFLQTTNTKFTPVQLFQLFIHTPKTAHGGGLVSRSKCKDSLPNYS